MTASTLMSKTKKELAEMVLIKEKAISQVSETNSALNAKIHELSKKYNELTNKYSRSCANIEDVVKQNKKLIEDNKKLVESATSMKNNYQTVINDSFELKNKVKTLFNQIEDANNTISSKQGRIEELNNQLKSVIKERDNYAQNAEDYEKEIDEMTTTNLELINTTRSWRFISFGLIGFILIILTILLI